MITRQNILLNQVDNFLTLEYKIMNETRRTKYKNQPRFLYPSSIGKCTRYIVLDMLGYPKPDKEPRILRAFKNGDSMHRRYQKWFEDLGILVSSEYPFKNEELRVSGRVDCLIYIKDLVPEIPDDIAVVELKSANAKQFAYMKKTNSPNPEYIDQLQLYLELLGFKYGVIMVENKNDQHVLEYWLEHDADHARKIIDKIKLINQHVDAGTIPPGDYKLDSYQCTHCDYREICGKDQF